MPADAGIRFGQYVLVRRIARGGMAEVFLAQQRGLEGFDRRVAVKRILPHLADSPDFVKMFFGEAKLAAQLSHPNVVHIYEFGKVDHDYFIAMEFVDGVHAGQVFKYGERERLPATLVARIGADAANALHYAHELRGANGAPLGLVHRDVSPANIMVSFDGIVKLCDFGIAKAAAAGDQLTNPGQVKGKYAYMSPEQTIAAQLDGRSDVFSLAIVMWELLTGKYIVGRGDAVAAMRAIRDGKLEPISKVAPDTPVPLAEAIQWALEPKRDKRATAAEFAQALEAFLKSAPDLATAMQLGGWVRARFPRENTGQVPAILPTGAVPIMPGTQMSPGTVVAPGTAAASPNTLVAPGTSSAARPVTQMPVTPASISPKRRVVRLLSETADGTEIYSTMDDLDDESAETIKGARPKPVTAGAPMRASEATAVARATDPTLHLAPAALGRKAPDEEDSENHFETILRDERVPIPSGPAVVPTRLQPSIPPLGAVAQSGTHAIGSGARPALPAEPRRTTPLPGELLRKRRGKLVVAIGALVALSVVSFVIALAASKKKDAPAATAPRDAASLAVVADAVALTVEPLPSEPPLDAAAEPTITADAATGVEDEMAHLIVRTIPDGGTIKVGDQSRLATKQPGDPTGSATAHLVLPPGKHVVTAELAGYQPEKRTVVLADNDNQRIEITFTKKLATRPDRGSQPGLLTVRTTPWSDVYLGSKKLGQAPFADLELPAGTHTLTFKNPSRPTVTKSVTIKAGKSTKLNFNL